MTTSVWLTLTQRSCLRSCDVTRTDTIALDVVFAIFRANVASEHLQATLSCCVCTHGFATKFRHHRADVDNLALSALHHLRDDSCTDDIRSHEVHVNHLLELSTLHLMHRDALDDTSIVHEDVNLTYLSMNLLNESLHSVLICHVANIALHILDASLLVVSKTTFKSSLVDVIENDGLDASPNKCLCNVETNTV